MAQSTASAVHSANGTPATSAGAEGPLVAGVVRELALLAGHLLLLCRQHADAALDFRPIFRAGET